jgi:hypothetical protein
MALIPKTRKKRWLMDEDPRFPNRKKRQDWDMSALDKKPADPNKPAPDGEQTEDVELPVNVYRVIGAAAKTKEEEQREREELYSFRESIPESRQAKVETPVYIPITEASVYQQPLRQGQEPPAQGWKERMRNFAESQTRVYAAIGVGLGILLGVIVAGLAWFTSTPNGRYDLGSVPLDTAGLKGHLFVEWDKQLNYRLSIEPSDPARQAAFALAVANSPHPLSIVVHLQDSQGFVMCSKEVLLKFDAVNAAQLAPPNPDAQGGKTDAATTASPQSAPGIDPAQSEAQEAAREKDKDIFKNQARPDGQITGLNAQGAIPCPAGSYEKAVSWSFLSTFPTVAEQDDMLERQKELQANGGRPPAQASVVRNKMAAKPAQKLLPFSIEGDDAIVDFDASRGIIETTAGKAFFIDRAGGAVSDSRWQDYPVEIHYRCDRSSECVLMHPGAGALHVRLRQ